jgi:two-component system, cell cycle sensor histidine kinase PleC
MTGRPTALFEPDVPQSALAALEDARAGAVIVVDLTLGRIAAANGAGLSILGLGTASSPTERFLDAATPALVSLRDAAASGSPPTRDLLVFWLPDGPRRLEASIEIVTAHDAVFAVVTHATHDAIEAEPPPPAAPNDGANAKEIAPLAVLSHELRTPLNAVLACADIMKHERFGPLGDARYLRYATDIHAAAQHILQLIERVLAADPVPDGSFGVMTFAEIDVAAELRSLVSQLAPMAERAGLTLALDAPPGLPHIVVDVTSLRQMILNLATNALKFTPHGGRIAIAADAAQDGTLAVTVTDTSAGLSPHEIEHLTSGPFDLRPASPKRSGLGIPIVRALASANGAEFALESAPGMGTSARIIFGKARVVPV